MISLYSCLIDHIISEALGKGSVKIQSQEEKTCKAMDIPLRKKNPETAKPMTAATENPKGGNDRKMLYDTDQSMCQSKVNVGNKADKENANTCTSIGDTTLCYEVTKDDREISSRNDENGQISQGPLTNQLAISTNTTAITSALTMDVPNNAAPPKLLSSGIRFEESRNTAGCNRGMNGENAKDSTDLLKTDESSVGLESAVADGEGEPPSTCQEIHDDDAAKTEEKLQISATPGGRKIKKKDKLTDTSSTAGKNTSNKVKPLGKRVRFNLEGNKSSDTQPLNSSEEIRDEEPQMMFSDEENEGDKCHSIDEDVSQRISRIQNLLRSDRLRTNRKRKFPVV